MIIANVGDAMPLDYVELVNSGLSLRPWYLITDQTESDGIAQQRKRELPNAPECIPFARKRNNDEFAALEIDIHAPKGQRIKGVIVDELEWISGVSPMAKTPEQSNTGNIKYSSITIIQWLISNVVPDVIEWEENPEQILKYCESKKI